MTLLAADFGSGCNFSFFFFAGGGEDRGGEGLYDIVSFISLANRMCI